MVRLAVLAAGGGPSAPLPATLTTRGKVPAGISGVLKDSTVASPTG